MNKEGVFIGQVCHIEAAETGGERFNANMSNEERRHFNNLMLMCYQHHTVTNDVRTYRTPELKGMKAAHEAKFSDPSSAMMLKLSDWTKAVPASSAENLRKYSRVFDIQLTPSQQAEMVVELKEYVDKFRRTPLLQREFLRAVIERTYHVRDLPAAVRRPGGGNAILMNDLAGALRLSEREIENAATQLESYGLGGIAEVNGHYGLQHGVAIWDLRSGWPLWDEIVKFCDLEKLQLSTFAIDMNFSQLDE